MWLTSAYLRSHERISAYRRDWCKKWLQRAEELGSEERGLRSLRPKRIRGVAASKRLLVTAEILQSLRYEDIWLEKF